MSQVAKLKKQAADFELKRQFDKAIAVYVKLLESFDQNAAELDVALFNRVGDLMLRQGNVADAVDYYERAVDRYADTGFFNNAIALCNKILRYSPGRASVYYKLGRISAQKGFTNEARTNFLEYADRMQKAGNVDEAFRALTEFADLCPDQHEIRMMLADQLVRAGRGEEAIEQFQVLYERYDRKGRHVEAKQLLERMRAIDPTVEPRSARLQSETTSSGLIFLDLDDDDRPPRPPSVPHPAAPQHPGAAHQFAPPPRLMPVPEPEAVSDQQAGLLDESLVADSLLGENLAEDAVLHERLDEKLDENLIEANLDELDFGNATRVDAAGLAGSANSADEGDFADADSVGDALDGVTRLGDDSPPLEIISSDSILGLEPTGLGEADPAVAHFDLLDLDGAQPTPTEPGYEDEVPLEGLPLVQVDGEKDEETDLHEESDESDDDDELIVLPTPSVARRATVEAAHSVEVLRARVDDSPNDWRLRRDLAELMLAAGERAQGIGELETAMSGAERSGDLELAASIAEEIARLEPDVIKHHQKRVEYAFRTNDRARLIEAYVALADVLFRSDQPDKARTIYQRVLDLAPDEPRARAGLDALLRGTPDISLTPTTTAAIEFSADRPAYREERPAVSSRPWNESGATTNQHAGGFVNLGEWLREAEAPKDTRMVVPDDEPTGDEQADFAEMLRKFKQGILENVAAEDYQSHYDLAIAYKEMGLLDEAIAEFQKALGNPTNRLPAYEALGQCFLEKGQFKLASSILGRALHERASEDQLVGILYWLGRAAELQNNPAEALDYYQRVFVLDIQFRDVADRMHAVERVWQ